MEGEKLGGISGEEETLQLYSKMYKELFTLGAIADAKYLECLIADVSDELAQANSLYIKKKSTDFDIESIMGDQEEKAEKYWQKITEIWR